MKRNKWSIVVMLVSVILQTILLTACNEGAEQTIVTKPHGTSSETTDMTENTIEATVDSSSPTTESAPSISTPCNPITSSDFRAVSEAQGYTVQDTNYEGSDAVAHLTANDADYFYYFDYVSYASEDLATEYLQDRYDTTMVSDTGISRDMVFENRTGYDIIIATSTSESDPIYDVLIRVDCVVIEAFTFSTDEAEMKRIDDFISAFGYDV